MVRQKVVLEQGKRHRDLVHLLDSLPSSANASTYSADADSRSRADSLGTEEDEIEGGVGVGVGGASEAERGQSAVAAAEQLLAGIATLKTDPGCSLPESAAVGPTVESKEG